ncbi:AAA domain-containing protein [Cuniculiplasma sp. SKW4]|uniref:AAA domain-containing protein n=1 Tax=Cuniculiplasma sp. SKW4 TaxID=3400171 RepID=UPI003FCF1B6C
MINSSYPNDSGRANSGREGIQSNGERNKVRNDHQEDLYYYNLGEEGEALKESSPQKLHDYFKLLTNYKKVTREKEGLAIFQIKALSNTTKKEQYADNGNYEVKISISPKVKPEDKEYAEYIMNRILDGEVTALKYYNSREQKNEPRLKVLESSKEKRVLLLDSMPKMEEVVPDLNDWSIQRQIDALEKLKDRPEPHHLPLLRLAGKNADKYWERPDIGVVKEWKVLKDSSFEGLAEQRDMVKKAIYTKDFAIVEGPPGSGKTTVITEIILQLLMMGKRVLLVGSTHVAVDNILENLIEYSKIVVPIRMAPMDRELQDKILDLTYDKFIKKFKERLLGNMLKIQNKTEIQNEWIGNLQSTRSDKFLEKILNESINLVSGTSFGVLQFPEIKESIRDKSFKPLFDVMIIDEASKTTFQEFLVPAMFARKWIISGDPKQLSPYTDSNFIEESIQFILEEEIKKHVDIPIKDVEKIVLKAYTARENINSSKTELKTVIALEDNELELGGYIKEQIESFKENKVIYKVPSDVKKEEEINEMIKIGGSDIIIIGKNQLDKFVDSLPYGVYFEETKRWSNFLSYRYNFFSKEKKPANEDRNDHGKEKKTLSGEIAWRLIRTYELRDSGDKFVKYQEDIKKLIPSKWDENPIFDEKTFRKITDLKYVCLPSIIEILIFGNSKINGFQRESVLVSGLPKQYRDHIWTRLSYQCRMHPEISYYPRTLVYSSRDQNVTALKDSKIIDREWNYKKYNERVVWINVYNKDGGRDKPEHNKNEAEASKIIQELKSFVDFASREPKKNGHWTVAILSFYKPQTRLLIGKMTKEFKKDGSTFYNNDKSVSISVGNVDSMQGKEADIVFLSMVRNGGLGFLDSPSRINVALTRARYQLVIFGNKKVFTKESYSDTLIYKFASMINSSFDL